MPSKLWRKLKKHLPNLSKQKGPGRPRVQDRDVLNGIWFVLWTGCQWKAVKQEWFRVSSSTLHERFQTWTKEGIFDKLFKIIVRFYARKKHIRWKWQSVVCQRTVVSVTYQTSSPTQRTNERGMPHPW